MTLGDRLSDTNQIVICDLLEYPKGLGFATESKALAATNALMHRAQRNRQHKFKLVISRLIKFII